MRLRPLLFSAIFTALTALGALFLKLPVPGTPLIITLQTLFVFMSGLLLEARYAFFSQLAYAAIGLMGLPVFSGGGGIAYVFQPSFGFIIGFCVCAPLISALVRKNLLGYISSEKKTMPVIKAILGALASVAVLYMIGVSYMYFIFNVYLGDPKTLDAVIILSQAGTFILVDIIKFALAIPLCTAVLKRISNMLRDYHPKSNSL